MSFPRLVLWVEALAFIGFGIAFTFWPRPMADLVGIALTNATARIDFAATYGGFEIGFGAFLAWCASHSPYVRVGLLGSGMALAGFALIRLQSMAAVSGTPGRPIYIALLLEVMGLSVAFLCARRTKTTA